MTVRRVAGPNRMGRATGLPHGRIPVVRSCRGTAARLSRRGRRYARTSPPGRSRAGLIFRYCRREGARQARVPSC
jgi:hypothetical protein